MRVRNFWLVSLWLGIPVHFPEVLEQKQAPNSFSFYRRKEARFLRGWFRRSCWCIDARTATLANVETLPETRRRKKSCGDLFQNGYRVRQGHHRQEDRDKRTGPRPVRSALRVLFNWGKSLIISVQIYVHQLKPRASLVSSICPPFCSL